MFGLGPVECIILFVIIAIVAVIVAFRIRGKINGHDAGQPTEQVPPLTGTTNCHECGAQNSSDVAFCKKCGANLFL